MREVRGLLGLLLLSWPAWGWSQAAAPPAGEAGIPFVRAYSPKEYQQDPQNWAVVQDGRGLLYFANNTGVLQYDGRVWQRFPVRDPQRNTNRRVRSLAIDDGGRIYVGAEGDFGYLQDDALGRYQFVSLRDQLPDSLQGFQNVWHLATLGPDVYLNLGTHLVRFGTSTVNVWPARSGDNLHTMFAVHDQVFVREWNVGLQRVRDGRLQLIPGGELFAGERVDAMVPYDKDRILIGTRRMGLFVFHPQLDLLQPLPSPIAPMLDSLQLYHGAALANGKFAFATLRGGVLVVGRDGRLERVFDTRVGLPDNNVHAVLPDRQGSLWLALDKGIAHVEYPSPFERFADGQGLRGTVWALQRHRGTLYAGTTAGVFAYRSGPAGAAGRFVPLRGLDTQVWDLQTVAGSLLAATTRGLYEVRGNDVRPLGNDNLPVSAFALVADPLDSNRAYVGRSDGLTAWARRGGEWRPLGPAARTDGLEVRWITPHTDGSLWFGDGERVFRLRAPGPDSEPEVLGTAQGVPATNTSFVFRAGDDALLASGRGLLRWTPSQNRFVLDQRFGPGLADSSRTVRLVVPEAGEARLWLLTQDNQPPGEYALQVAEPGPQNRFRLRNDALRRLRGFSVRTVYPDPAAGGSAGQVVWLAGDDGIVRYDPAVRKPYTRRFTALVRRVTTRNDSLVFAGEVAPGDTLPDAQPVELELPYSLNSLRFEVAAPSFDGAEGLQFRYRMDGLDDNWTRWGSEPTRDFTNLAEGSYTFRVQARNAYGVESTIGVYRIHFRPPWQRTWWAYALYVLGFGLAVYGIVRWRLARLEREKQHLEQVVHERTAEVVRQKEAIEAASVEIRHKNAELENAYEEIRATNESLNEAYHRIEEQNQDMLDSITYAKRIQEAFLPTLEDIRSSLPEAFILFKPRDIVSGDFYWHFRREGYLFLAAADCTGHGVPGAFMSMLGNSLLNEIVGGAGLLHPSDILEELDRRVRLTLRQTLPGAKTKDGMEIALFRIDAQRQELLFAAANRPMLHFRGGECTEIRGTKRAIGGGTPTDEADRFSTHAIAYAPADRVYTFSDGYGDQFGGERGKKFMVKNLLDLITEIHQQPMDAQAALLDHTIESWRGERPQVDDILVIGLRL